MNEDDLERTLREAFSAQARGALDDGRPAPPPRFLTEPAAGRGSRVRWLAPLAAAVAVLGLVGGVLAVVRTGSDSGPPKVVAGRSVVASATDSGPASPAASTAARSVHVRLFNADGVTYGVGMPVIAIFSHKITNARPFVRATSVTVNGRPTDAAWYFEHSAAGLGAMEAHLRPSTYWPAHARVHVSLATQGLAAGKGMVFDDSLTLDFSTGAKTVATVDNRTNYLTVTSDGTRVATMPVALGAAKTPTSGGTKVIMAKAEKVRIKGPGFNEVTPYALRLTYSGEYLVGSPGNSAGVKKRLDTSNGCTDLLVQDAARLYEVLRVGDPVEYENADGRPMPQWDGFGDWNVPWSKWQAGGLLPTS